MNASGRRHRDLAWSLAWLSAAALMLGVTTTAAGGAAPKVSGVVTNPGAAAPSAAAIPESARFATNRPATPW